MSGSRADVVRDGLRPWWRSVGFWVGLWGMVFLVWVWVDSFSHASWVITRKEATVGMMVEYQPFRGAVHEGRLILQFERPVDATAELKYEMRRPEVGRGEELLFVYYANSAWGRKVWRSGNVWIASFTSDYEVREWWCSMGFVVAGYVVVWVCGMVVWRRWRYRRWRGGGVC